MPAEAGHRKRRNRECPPTNLLPHPPTDRPHARAERPYTHTTLPTVYTRPTDRPNPPTDAAPTDRHPTWEMSTERGGIGTVFRVPMKPEGECRPRAGHRKRRTKLCSGYTHTPIYYTFLLSFLLSSQQDDTSTNTPSGVGVRSCVASLLNLLSSLWLRLDRSSMELCSMSLTRLFNF